MVLYPQQLPIRGYFEPTNTSEVMRRLSYLRDAGQRGEMLFHTFFTPPTRYLRAA